MNYLTLTNPRLLELKRRYAKHPAASHTQWSESFLLDDLALSNFRGENHYLYQVRYTPKPEAYCILAYYVRDHDKFNLFGRLIEDGMFGAYTLSFEDGYLISRDLLDSINEINFIYRMLERDAGDAVTVLDIGAGYGRLAHRLAEGFPAARVICTDAVAYSTFLCEFYLGFRSVSDRVQTIPVDQVLPTLESEKIDVVTNIHSFSECKRDVIEWWLGAIEKLDVCKLMLVPNATNQLLSTESNGQHKDFSDLLAKFGWRLAHKEPIFGESKVAQQFALYPKFCFYWFDRH